MSKSQGARVCASSRKLNWTGLRATHIDESALTPCGLTQHKAPTNRLHSSKSMRASQSMSCSPTASYCSVDEHNPRPAFLRPDVRPCCCVQQKALKLSSIKDATSSDSDGLCILVVRRTAGCACPALSFCAGCSECLSQTSGRILLRKFYTGSGALNSLPSSDSLI